MTQYAIRRVLLMFPTLIFVALVTFALAQVAPGSPFERNPDKPLPPSVVENLTRKYGLDRPIHEQFGIYLANAVRLDFGESIVRRRPVAEIIGQGLPVTAQLGLQAMVVALVVAIPLGIVSALRQNTIVDYGSVFFATVGTTIPSFVLGIFSIYIFGVALGWVPFVGWGSSCGVLPSCDVKRMVLPTVLLAAGPAAFLTRLTRAAVLEAVRQDFIRTARSKGLRERAVIFVHALRNALIPIVTIIGPVTAGLLVGSFFIEYIFNIPGSGREYIRAINSRDYPVIMGTTMLYALFIVVANLVVDLTYGVVDPRIKVGR
ncbi:MAG: ABC transporter permease [Chloroflexi bacterium]|nr:ABC transporter permease [Chloroflexota bacterium]